MPALLGAVIAGGESRRMGSDKAELVVDGQPLWRRQAGVLRKFGIGRIVIARRPGQLAPADWICRRDLYANAGPLAGLHAALAGSVEAWTAVLAVDMPGIGPDWFHWLWAHCRPGVGAVARHAEAFEPLAAIYPREALAEVEARLRRRDLSLQRMAGSLAGAGRLWSLFVSGVGGPAVESLNTPAQLRRNIYRTPAS